MYLNVNLTCVKFQPYTEVGVSDDVTISENVTACDSTI
jgi:hypothetical protein